MPKKIDPALRERAVRLVLEHRAEYPSTAKAIAAVARQECVGAESLRRWVVQAEIDAGDRDGQTSEEHAEIRRLKAEDRALREDVAILKAATALRVNELTPEERVRVRFSPDIPGRYIGIVFENEIDDRWDQMPIPPELFAEIQEWVIEKDNDPWQALYRTIDARLEEAEFQVLAQKLANALGQQYHVAVRVAGKVGVWTWVEPELLPTDPGSQEKDIPEN